MFIGIAPGANEVKEGKVFVGQSGKLLNAILKAVDWPREKCYVTNLICWWENNPTTAQIDQCHNRLEEEIRRVNPKLIVTLGKIPTEYMTGKSFSEASGCPVWSEDYQCWIMGTNHPSAALRGLQNAVSELVRDLSKIVEVKDWPEHKGIVRYKVVETSTEAQQVLSNLPLDRPISVDVETDWDTYDITCLSISDGETTWEFPRKARVSQPHETVVNVCENLQWPTYDPVQWTFHNGAFDTLAIERSLGVFLPIVEDTMLMSYSLDERTGGRDENDNKHTRGAGYHGLKRLAREYCGAGFYNVDTRTCSLEELWAYNAADAAYTAQLANRFKPLQEADNVREMYLQYLIRGAEVVKRQKEYGVFIDRRELVRLGFEWASEAQNLQEELLEMAKAAGMEDINFQSPQQVSKLLYDYMGLPYTEFGRTTKADALELLEDISPFVSKFLRLRKLARLINNYVESLDDKLDSNSRIHPDALLHGTTSGRLSYRFPPIQTIPKHRTADNIRRIFAAPSDEYEIMQADFRQSELWTNWYITGDENMLADLEAGEYYHHSIE